MLQNKVSQNKVFHINIEKETLRNDKFRVVLHTNTKQQLVIMSIDSLDDIPLEIHSDVDQFIRVERGTGRAITGEKQDSQVDLSDGSVIMIPAGTWHRILNTSSTEPLKLYSIYSPPEHPVNRVDNVKPKSTESHESHIPTNPTQSPHTYQTFTKSSIFRRLHKF